MNTLVLHCKWPWSDSAVVWRNGNDIHGMWWSLGVAEHGKQHIPQLLYLARVCLLYICIVGIFRGVKFLRMALHLYYRPFVGWSNFCRMRSFLRGNILWSRTIKLILFAALFAEGSQPQKPWIIIPPTRNTRYNNMVIIIGNLRLDCACTCIMPTPYTTQVCARCWFDHLTTFTDE